MKVGKLGRSVGRGKDRKHRDRKLGGRHTPAFPVGEASGQALCASGLTPSFFPLSCRQREVLEHTTVAATAAKH